MKLILNIDGFIIATQETESTSHTLQDPTETALGISQSFQRIKIKIR